MWSQSFESVCIRAAETRIVFVAYLLREIDPTNTTPGK